MDDRVVVIHSTSEEDIGRLVVRELGVNGRLYLNQLFEWQKGKTRPFFSILYRDDVVLDRYREQKHLIYQLNDGIIESLTK